MSRTRNILIVLFCVMVTELRPCQCEELQSVELPSAKSILAGKRLATQASFVEGVEPRPVPKFHTFSQIPVAKTTENEPTPAPLGDMRVAEKVSEKVSGSALRDESSISLEPAISAVAPTVRLTPAPAGEMRVATKMSVSAPRDESSNFFGAPISGDCPTDLLRDWTPVEFHWNNAGVVHQPTCFEDRRLELDSISACPSLQPVLSGVRFYATIATLPIKTLAAAKTQNRSDGFFALPFTESASRSKQTANNCCDLPSFNE